MTRSIVIASGKGGTGKTTVTAAVGCALGKLGYRCLLIDADAGMQSLDMVLGVSEDTAFNFADAARGTIPVEDAAAAVGGFPNVFVLAAPPQKEQAEADMLRTVVDKVSSENKYDYILIDAPAGIGAGFRDAASAADRAIIVATADPVCLRSADKCAAALEGFGIEKINLAVNRVRRAFIRHGLPNLDDAADMTATQLIGYVPEDKMIVYCASASVPLLSKPGRRSSRALMNIAKRITGEYVPLL